MSSAPQRTYEFTPEQNTLLNSLAGKMSGVGLFLVLVGIINLVFALLVVAGIYRERLPKEYVDAVVAKVTEASRVDVESQLKQLPPDNTLWSIAAGAALNGLLPLLMGSWMRSSAGSFRQIVQTRGDDIGHLMEGLGSLNKMFGLVHTLLVAALLAILVMAGLYFYGRFMG